MPPLEPAVLLQHADFVRALARSLVRDHASAEDLEQETWLRALRRGPRGSTNLRGWLAAIARNALRNRGRESARRAQRERLVARADEVGPSSQAAEQAGTLRRVIEAVVALEEPYRSTVFALYFQGLSASELARRDGAPMATVRSRHQRALAQLRERLDRSHGSREAWSIGLAHLAGLESAGNGLWAAGLVTAAALVVMLVGGGLWWLGARSTDVAAPLGATLATASPTPPPPPASRAAESTTAAAEHQRSELGAGQIAVLGIVEDFDPNESASGARAAHGAKVRVRVLNNERETLSEIELTTGERGAFEWRLADLGVRPLSFSVEAAGAGLFQAASARARLATDDERSAHVSVRRKALADIALRVERAGGAPLANVRVGLLKLDNATRLERASGADGVVRFERSSDFGRFDLLEPGWAPIGFEAPSEQPDGSWASGVLVAAASGALSVRVVDGRGAPLDDVDVFVSRQAWERDLEAGKAWGGPLELGQQSSRVDSGGVATFGSVVADTDLVVRVVRGRETFVGSERSASGELQELGSDGFALRVAPGGSEQFLARWSERIDLELPLARRDGAALERVEFTVLDAGRANRNERTVHQSSESRPSAPLRVQLQGPRFVGPLVLFAREERESDAPVALSGLGYAGSAASTSRALSTAWRTLLLPRRAGSPARLERGEFARSVEVEVGEPSAAFELDLR